jgi:hypothetical protein
MEYKVRTGRPLQGSLEEIAIAMGSNKTSARDHALRLHEEGLLVAPPRNGDGSWSIDPRPPSAAEVPSAADVRRRRGLIDPARLKARGERSPQRTIAFAESGPPLAVVSEEERVPLPARNGIRRGTGTGSDAEEEPVPLPRATPLWEPGGETPRAGARTRAFDDDSYDLSTSTIEPKGGDLKLTIDGLCRRLWPAGRKIIDSPPDLRTLYWFALLLKSPEHHPWAEHILDMATLKPHSGEKRMRNPFAYLQRCLQEQQPWIVGTFVPAEFVKPLAVPGPANTAPADRPASPGQPTSHELDKLEKQIRVRYLTEGVPFEEALWRAARQVEPIRARADPQPPKPR